MRTQVAAVVTLFVAAPALAALEAPPMADMPGMDHAAHAGMAEHEGMAGRSGHVMAQGAYGPYPGTREASGTSWQPDTSTHEGLHGEVGGWTLMAHGTLNLVYTSQSGPRGDDKTFVAGHFMATAARNLSPDDRLQFRAAVSPDPLMGARGYPLLLAAGETANGRSELVDRQHPHDLFSELSVSLAHRFGDQASAFVYAGLPGEPAFGPPAYLHRASIMDDPEAPISHHWLDSTHVSFGIVTVGLVYGNAKVEASRFKGREPDQHRYDIERPKFDSTAARLSWNPTPRLALQASWAHLVSTEQLAPDEDQERWSASAIYTLPVGERGSWTTTAAWGRRTSIEHGARGPALDAWVLESTVKPDDRWTVFGRAERTDQDELVTLPGGGHGPVYTVGKVSLGAIRDIRIGRNLKAGLGALVSRSFTPAGLDPVYGGDQTSGLVFLRFRLV